MLSQTIKTRGLHAGIRFAPLAVLDKQHRQQFQLKTSEGFDWQRQEYAENVWRLVCPQSDGDPRSQLKLTLQNDIVNFEESFPTTPTEVFLDNLKLALESVASVFGPKLILATGITVRMTAHSAQDDARVYLGKQCLNLDDRLEPLGRPIHAVGLKMLLPPVPGQGRPNWQAEVKVETLVEDVQQLFIEVDARWGSPTSWDPAVATDRVKTAFDFTANQVVDFIQKLGQPRM